MGRQVTAGLLDYSSALYDQIEEHMMRVYAAMFVPTLEATIKSAQKKLTETKDRVHRGKKAAGRLAKGPTQQDLNELLELIMPLAMAGILGQEGIDIHKLVAALSSGNQGQAKKILKQVRNLLIKLEEEAEQALGAQAKGMSEDLEAWKDYFDPKFADELERHAKKHNEIPPLKIKLDRSQFPFLQGRFEDNVRKLRGAEAGLFDDLVEMEVSIAPLGAGKMGYWDSKNGRLVVGLPDLAPKAIVEPQLKHTLRHELTHVTQSVMADALGVEHLKQNEDGEFIPAYLHGPGMAPRDAIDLDIHQSFAHSVDALQADIKALKAKKKAVGLSAKEKKHLKHLEGMAALRDKVMKAKGLESKHSAYSLDDMEFYTSLADRVWDFNQKVSELQLTDDQLALARDLAIGRKWLPKSEKAGRKWIEENDPTLAVVPHFVRGDSFFRHLKKYQPKKYQKAVKEFIKASASSLEQLDRPQGDLAKQWEEFLGERYESGKKKVPNPNHETRESHPEISVNYLMKQSDPAYSSSRNRIRREFQRWRMQQGHQPVSIFTRHFARLRLKQGLRRRQSLSDMGRLPRQGGMMGYPPKMYEEISRWIRGVDLATTRDRLQKNLAHLSGASYKDEILEHRDALEKSMSEDDYVELYEWTEELVDSSDELPEHLPSGGEFAQMSKEDKKKIFDELSKWFDDKWAEKAEANKDQIAELKGYLKEKQDQIDALGLDEDPKPGIQKREFEVDLEDWDQARDKELAERGRQKLPKVTVHYTPFDHGFPSRSGGNWDEKNRTIYVRNRAFHPHLQTLKHELRHMGQSVLSEATGHRRRDEGPVTRSRPAPGMPSRHIMNPDVQQSYQDTAVKSVPGAAQPVLRRLKELGFEADDLHALDDVEFYTRLGDSVDKFQEVQRYSKWSPKETRTALGIFTGAIPTPKTREDWKKADPEGNIQHRVGPDPSFRAWKKHNIEKWKKAAKELVKAAKRGEEKPSSLEGQWKEFLDEQYEGGKKKVPNPNHKTRDAHPEITVGYLMKQTDPAYSNARKKIRGEFARWRSTRSGTGDG